MRNLLESHYGCNIKLAILYKYANKIVGENCNLKRLNDNIWFTASSYFLSMELPRAIVLKDHSHLFL